MAWGLGPSRLLPQLPGESRMGACLIGWPCRLYRDDASESRGFVRIGPDNRTVRPVVTLRLAMGGRHLAEQCPRRLVMTDTAGSNPLLVSRRQRSQTGLFCNKTRLSVSNFHHLRHWWLVKVYDIDLL